MRRIAGKIAVVFIIVILVAQVLSVLPAAGTANPPGVTWFKYYGGSGKDYATSVIPTIDGGYMVGGYTYSLGAGWADFWLDVK